MRRLGLLLVALATACVPPEEHTALGRGEWPLPPGGALVVRVPRGTVVVAGDAEATAVEATLRKRVRAPAATSEGWLATIRLVADELGEDRLGLRVELAEPRAAWPAAVRLDSELRLVVPARVDLDVATGDGAIELADVDGDVRAATEDGSVRLRRLRGTIRVRTSDGSIAASGLAGDVDLETDDGRIEVEGRFGRLRAVSGDGRIVARVDGATSLAADWLLWTADGSLRIALPRTVAARIDAATGDGVVEDRGLLLRESGGEGALRGRTAEAATHWIVLRTGDGRVVLDAR